MSNDQYFRANQELWDGWAKLHQQASSYDVEGFRKGNSTLKEVELRELGDVSGKTMLHLQCHFGLDTLSWARRGAKVTGVDFSEEAVRAARALSLEAGLEARFVRSNVYDLRDSLTGLFDIVFASYGVLEWLPDLKPWAETIAHFLKPGGKFYLVEFHPFAHMLDDEGKSFSDSYFNSSRPYEFEEQGSYASRDAEFRHTLYVWPHSFSEIINSLISAGLRLEFINEHPYSVHNCWPFLEEGEAGRWHVRGRPGTIPLLFSLQATTAA